MIDTATGDATGLAIPAHLDAFLEAGADFLTEAFRAFGTISADNAVTAITACAPCVGGSTGHKYYISIEYASPEPGLDRDLFLKFSRDFTDERRDWQRTEMASEARFIALSRQPGFPIRVPRGYFADYETASGTGIVITERIRYGEGGIEPHRRKTMDHVTVDDPLAYYRASVGALGRLAGAHKAGTLSPEIDRLFPWDSVTGTADPIRYTRAELDTELDCCDAFARDLPQLLPGEVRDPAFMAKLREDAHFIRENEAALQGALTADPDLIALCHWNAHIDNLFFWREAGALQCGLIDWGRVGQLTFGSILWGGLSAAHHAIWDVHLDALLSHFLTEYERAGGPHVPLAKLKRHLVLHMAVMGVARVLAFPEIIRFRLPGIEQAAGPRDAMFDDVDPARNCLSVYTVWLKHWLREDFGSVARHAI